jgi:hypothetical protein
MIYLIPNAHHKNEKLYLFKKYCQEVFVFVKTSFYNKFQSLIDKFRVRNKIFLDFWSQRKATQ